jgi:hypothetical protein
VAAAQNPASGKVRGCFNEGMDENEREKVPVRWFITVRSFLCRVQYERVKSEVGSNPDQVGDFVAANYFADICSTIFGLKTQFRGS